LNNFGRGPPWDHPIIPVKFGQNPNEQFQRLKRFKEIADALTMDNRQWAITKAHLEHIVLR